MLAKLFFLIELSFNFQFFLSLTLYGIMPKILQVFKKSHLRKQER